MVIKPKQDAALIWADNHKLHIKTHCSGRVKLCEALSMNVCFYMC